MKKYIPSLMIGLLFVMPVFAHADHTIPHTIEQLQARIADLRAQISILLASGAYLENGNKIEAPVSLRIRSLPTKFGAISGNIIPGSVGIIRCDLVFGASCPVMADGYRWWYVDWDSPEMRNGWSAEGRGAVSFLRKVSGENIISATLQPQASSGPQTPVALPESPVQNIGFQPEFIPQSMTSLNASSPVELVESSEEQASDPGTIIIFVKDSACATCGNLIRGQVSLRNESKTLVKTSSLISNSAVFSNIAPGIYTAYVFADNYLEEQEDVEIDSGESVTATVLLDSSVEDE